MAFSILLISGSSRKGNLQISIVMSSYSIKFCFNKKERKKMSNQIPTCGHQGAPSITFAG